MPNTLPEALNVSPVSRTAHATCPYCRTENYFNDTDHPALFSNECGDVECDDDLLCGESFHVDLREGGVQ